LVPKIARVRKTSYLKNAAAQRRSHQIKTPISTNSPTHMTITLRALWSN
jgi:hypothetical protein